MALNPYVLDASQDNFDALVLGNSARGLVLVHYWTPKAGPCMILMPRLVRLAAEYGGRFLLVMANTDELGRVARDQGVASVPTVKFYLRGEVVHTIHGAEPDSTFRDALARFVARPEDRLRAEALRAHQAGRTAEAIELLARAAVDRPGDLAISADLAKLLTLDGQADQALALLDSLPAEARRDERIAPMRAHLQLLDAAGRGPADAEARLAADAADHEARLALAARALLDDRPQEAMAGLLALARAAPDYREDIGRRGLIALFGMLGPEHELTRRFRAELARGA
ncbi:MAG: tetratricopeptide repeat protein [Thiobacillaceae bacterium]|jgi:putative thioredoxin|nr:tetratricopeptide repeat protein [Thiobacillaceae bacterium]